MDLERDPLDDVSTCEVVDSIVHDVTTLSRPFFSLHPQSHAHSSAVSWWTRLSSRKTQDAVTVLCFYFFHCFDLGDKCGPLSIIETNNACHPISVLLIKTVVSSLVVWGFDVVAGFSCSNAWSLCKMDQNVSAARVTPHTLHVRIEVLY